MLGLQMCATVPCFYGLGDESLALRMLGRIPGLCSVLMGTPDPVLPALTISFGVNQPRPQNRSLWAPAHFLTSLDLQFTACVSPPPFLKPVIPLQVCGPSSHSPFVGKGLFWLCNPTSSGQEVEVFYSWKCRIRN